jgi:aminoglycoside phosphotransferase (APT) family kinase protein
VELDGWDNATFRLGDDLTVRLPSADPYAAQVEKEQRWLPVLAPHLPLRIPEPVARGEPSDDFSRPWSVYRWIEGEPAAPGRVTDLESFALDLAHFTDALRRIDATDGPAAGAHSFNRGGPLDFYDAQTRKAISSLRSQIDADRATELWDEARAAVWDGPPTWLHGDVTAANLLVRDGRLAAVLDFGCCAVGDPACDLAIAWTFFDGPSRAAFRDHGGLDDATWARGRGWALWKALVTLTRPAARDAAEAAARFGWRLDAGGVVDEVLAG